MLLSYEQRLEIMRYAGYEFWDYDGKIANAPRQIRHLARELERGTYVVNYKFNRIAGGRIDVKTEQRTTQAFVQAFKDQFNKQGWLFFKLDYRDGVPVYAHYDVQSFSAEAKTAERLTLNRDAGYYAITGQVVIGAHTFPVDLVDALIENFNPELLTNVVQTDDPSEAWIFTEFGGGRGGIITDGPVEGGLVVAYLPQHEHSHMFGRLAVVAPDLFQLAYEIASHSEITLDTMLKWQNQARLLVGHINS